MMMPEKLYGSSNKNVKSLVINKDGVIYAHEIKLGGIIPVVADVEYVKDEEGSFCVENIKHEDVDYYYIIHSEEVMKIRSKNTERIHSKYSKV